MALRESSLSKCDLGITAALARGGFKTAPLRTWWQGPPSGGRGHQVNDVEHLAVRDVGSRLLWWLLIVAFGLFACILLFVCFVCSFLFLVLAVVLVVML